ncbi:MAG: hypothetical protein LBE04_00945 [Prevotellaceae bacterium]|nr:hypothetical protein [Prevotellaceae bacterium]
MKKINISLMLFLVLLSGCKSNEYIDFTDTQIPVKNAETQFSAIGGQKEFTLNFSDTYTVTSDQSWCKATINNNTVTVNVEPNRTISGRTALLTLKSGNKVNYIPVTQTKAVIRLESYTYDLGKQKDTVYVKYECDFPVNVSPVSVDWVKSLVNHDKKEIMFVVEEEQNYPRSTIVQLYADGGNNTVLTVKEIRIRQNLLLYKDFLGTYNMYYFTGIVTDTLEVSLVAGVSGKSYFLKGILTDEDAGNIIVDYNELTGSLFFWGCKIRAAGNGVTKDFWWSPSQKTGASYYPMPSNAYGMKSQEHNISGKLKFSLGDNTIVGFILRKYTGTTISELVKGKDGQSMYLYLNFEKK